MFSISHKLMRDATHAPFIPPSSSLYNKKISFKEKVVSGDIRDHFFLKINFFKEKGETKGG